MASATSAPGVKDPSLSNPTAAPQTAPQAEPREMPLVEKAPERQAYGVLVDINGGTQGIGMSLGYEFNPHLKMRLRGAYMGYDYSDDWGESDLKTDGKLEFDGSNAGLILDYHPFAGRFRISGGLTFAQTKVKLSADLQATVPDGFTPGKSYEFGGIEYRANGSSGNVHGEYSWNTVQPYLGIGWSSDGDGDRSLYFTIDLGVNFIGSGSLSVGASSNIESSKDGGQTWQGVSNVDLEHSVREEGKDFFKIADDLYVYPVLQLGVGYRF